MIYSLLLIILFIIILYFLLNSSIFLILFSLSARQTTLAIMWWGRIKMVLMGFFIMPKMTCPFINELRKFAPPRNLSASFFAFKPILISLELAISISVRKPNLIKSCLQIEIVFLLKLR